MYQRIYRYHTSTPKVSEPYNVKPNGWGRELISDWSFLDLLLFQLLFLAMINICSNPGQYQTIVDFEQILRALSNI